MRKVLPLILLIMIGAAVIIFFAMRSTPEKKYSKIVEKNVEVGGKVVAKYKIAEISSRTRSGKEMEAVMGKVVIVPNNPSDIYSKMMVAIKNEKEIIVVTNPQFVRTLGYIYFDKKVSLKGRWQKDAIIFGRKYRCFRVEDIKLEK